MSDLMLDVSQAHEIKMASRRAGATNEDLKVLSSGDMFARILPVLRSRAEVVVESILDLITNVRLEAQPRFVAKEKFVEDTSDSAEVKFAYMSDSFRNRFLGKTEIAVGAVEIAVHKLTKDSLDAPILAKLGEKAEITLSQFYAMLARQGHGQSGPLLTNRYVSISYIRDVINNLWVVGAYWHAGHGGWVVFTRELQGPDRWDAGRPVLSRL